ncbi:uncharacterized protein LOC142559666 [Dermacentor variabilis]|uniref:uncharacterized protein LOC142559666 n=1 Tax=Dermacentor variabilis TaxID=34621 RepID=UPI003F5BCE4D
MSSLATVFLVGFLSSAYAENAMASSAPSFQELLEFLNTTEKIWTYLQSNSDIPKCISRTRTSLTQSNYECRLHTRYPQKTEQESASLQRKGTYPEMVVTKQGGAQVTYTFKYFNTNEWCGIFTYKQNSETQCEMRVWNERVDASERTDCEKCYDKYCERKHKVYENYCQL